MYFVLEEEDYFKFVCIVLCTFSVYCGVRVSMEM